MGGREGQDGGGVEGYVVTPGPRRGALADLWRRRGVLGALALREVRVRYRHPVLGALWAAAPPLLLTAAATWVFHRALSVPADGAPYPLFVLAGLVPWTYFQGAVTAAVPSLVNDASLVRKIWFPREAIPLAPVVAGLLDLGAGAAAWAVVAAALGHAPSPLPALWVVPLLVPLVAFTAACALLGAAVNVPWRDVKHAVPLLLQLLFFATPVVYPLSAVPEGLRPLVFANPVACVVEGLRRALLHGEAPGPDLLLPAAAASVGLLAAAWLLFKAADRRFADVV